MNREFVREQLSQYKISQLQLDPFGFCNARCWFCPVKYQGNPEHAREHMSVDLLHRVLKNIIDERDRPDGLVDSKFWFFYTAHYNEVLLYKHFEDLLKISREFKLQFMVLTNGIPLTPEKTDLILEYSDVVNGICFNVPAFEPELWSKRVGVSDRQFDRLISNIHYAQSRFVNLMRIGAISIQVNGVDSNSFEDRGGWLTKGSEFLTDIDLDPETGEVAQQVNLAKAIFPGMPVYARPNPVDRAGSLDSIISNKSAIVKFLQRGDSSKNVIGCTNGREVGGRTYGWLHVNSLGQVFLCCNDINMDVVFGDMRTQELRDFWGSYRHIDKILESYQTICRTCSSAKFED